MVATVTREQVLSFRIQAQQLDLGPTPVTGLGDCRVLDIGAQDTGPDAATWALTNRGVDLAQMTADALVTVWTIRGAPHVYRRDELPSVAAAVAPFSEADAGKRIYDAAKPLKAAGIANLHALDAIAQAMRATVTRPMLKGEVSSRLTALIEPPYLRFCRPCNATHIHEMPFRLAALRAGVELEAGTSPPVLRRIAGFIPATAPSLRYDVVRAYLRLLGPATHKQVADYLDAPVKDVRDRWPADADEVMVEGQRRWVLSADADQLTSGSATTTRLLGPFDLFLQARDRQTLMGDPARAKALWPVLGRPGAVLLGNEIAGLWRPRKAGRYLRVSAELWVSIPASVRTAITEQAERLAAHRQTTLAGVDFTG